MAAEATVSEEQVELASTRVFATTELLEHILIYVPARDVLLAQRVSHRWQAVVTESPSLQELLLFTGEVIDPAVWITQCPAASHSEDSCVWDGLFVRYMDVPPGQMFVPPGFPEWPDVLNTGSMAHLHVKEPLARLFAKKPVMFVWPGDDHASPISGPPTQLARKVLHESATRPEASWRRMLQLNPPIVGNTSVPNTTPVAIYEGLYARAMSATGENADGCIRFGRLYDAAVDAQRETDEARCIRREERRLEGGYSEVILSQVDYAKARNI
ncbi:hypothetical protein LTR10_007257 [Elasticomyces elasticus]|nr:hypothetical protein LTR10_007257 [Elasticomyces elasticus]KAK4979073.1 hypothetical protein LTR42_001573 [Elasticomyces elasticus]